MVPIRRITDYQVPPRASHSGWRCSGCHACRTHSVQIPLSFPARVTERLTCSLLQASMAAVACDLTKVTARKVRWDGL